MAAEKATRQMNRRKISVSVKTALVALGLIAAGIGAVIVVEKCRTASACSGGGFAERCVGFDQHRRRTRQTVVDGCLSLVKREQQDRLAIERSARMQSGARHRQRLHFRVTGIEPSRRSDALSNTS